MDRHSNDDGAHKLEIVRIARGIGSVRGRADEIAELRKLLSDPQRCHDLVEHISVQPLASRERCKRELDDLSEAFERSAETSRVSARFVEGVGRFGLAVGAGATVAIAVATAPVSGPLLIASLLGFSLYGGSLAIQLLSDMSEVDDRAASNKCKKLADAIDVTKPRLLHGPTQAEDRK